MDGQDRRHVLECRPKVQGGPDGHSHQWLHSVFPATGPGWAEGEGLLAIRIHLPAHWLHSPWSPSPISKLTFPYKLLLSGWACAPCHACPGAACWETARGVLTAPTPTTTRAIQSRVWKRLWRPRSRAPAFLSQPTKVSPWVDGQRVIWRGERPTARYSDGRSLVTYFHRLDSGTVRSSLVTNFQSRAIWAHPSLLGQQLKTFHQLIQNWVTFSFADLSESISLKFQLWLTESWLRYSSWNTRSKFSPHSPLYAANIFCNFGNELSRHKYLVWKKACIEYLYRTQVKSLPLCCLSLKDVHITGPIMRWGY